jgi:hypothetical protein
VDWTDRGTCVLFGDGAGAVFLRGVPQDQAGGRGILSTHLHADGRHGDILAVDGGAVMVGSANLDIRSLRINFELNVLLDCAKTTEAAERLFVRNEGDAVEVTVAGHRGRSGWQRIAEAVCRPLAPLL